MGDNSYHNEGSHTEIEVWERRRARERTRPVASASKLRQAIASLADQLAEVEKFGEDEYKNGTVLTFKLKYAESPRWFTYAAVKADGRWWLTGRHSTPFTWSGLVDFLTAPGRKVRGLRVATGFRKLLPGASEQR